MTTAPLLYSGNKDLEKIKQITISIEVAYMARWIIRATADLTMIAKKNRSEKNDLRPNEKYFNYGKKGHYTRNYYNSISNKRKSIEKLMEKTKRIR